MILRLRQCHRRIFTVLGVFLPIAFAVGIVERKPVPAVAQLPPALIGAPQDFRTVLWEHADLFSMSPVRVRLLREQNNSGRFTIRLSAPDKFLKPDLMVYWVAGSPDRTNALPENAILLGAFPSAALPLPAEAEKTSGVLVLYSLADAEIVDVSKPCPFNDSTQ